MKNKEMVDLFVKIHHDFKNSEGRLCWQCGSR